ncbi:MAG TPA: hypothetical protein PLD54_01130, partial [Candidatus Levybacteria bacterium]|nr:hypothetical protein [Candidatus Levybacteria bacterium]
KIYNDVVHTLNTGGNSANGNIGDVAILTGDVKSTITITNEVNSNYVEIDCGCKEKPEEPEEPELPEPGRVRRGVGGVVRLH